MNVAVILAGGSGSRLGDTLPKQFHKVAGKKVIEHTINVFEKCNMIDEICIVSKLEYVKDVEQIIVDNCYKKVKKILCGGDERYKSSLSAIDSYDNDEYNLIFHDAVRPLVSEKIISECLIALNKYNAVDVAIKTTDTIIKVNEYNCIESIPNRSVLRNGQTPQCFKRRVIKKAYDIALQDPNFQTTDDCGVVRMYLPQEPIYVVNGDVFNMKLTYVEDLFLIDKLFQLKFTDNIDVKLTEKTIAKLKDSIIVVFGGSYGIGYEVCKIANERAKRVHSFSRTQNNVDVSDYDAVSRALKSVYVIEGRIDVVINTAGVLYKESLDSMSNLTIENTIRTNFLGVVNVTKASFEYLRESKGSLLFYTSSSYTRGRMMYSIYSATKAAIVNFVQAIAEEWSTYGIKVNCINPERTKTPMRISNFGNEPDGTLLDPQSVALASINTVFSECTGEVIDVRRR